MERDSIDNYICKLEWENEKLKAQIKKLKERIKKLIK